MQLLFYILLCGGSVRCFFHCCARYRYRNRILCQGQQHRFTGMSKKPSAYRKFLLLRLSDSARLYLLFSLRRKSLITGLFQRQQFSAVMLHIIAHLAAPTAETLLQHADILRIHLVFCRIFFIQINIFPVHRRHKRNIGSSFHPALYFKGVDSCFDQLWKNWQCTKILQAELIWFFLCTDHMSVRQQLIRQSARTGAPPSVPASRSEHA